MSRLRLGLLAVVRRCTEWTRAGLWVRLRQQFLHRFGILSEIDRSSAVVDSISIRPQKGATKPAQTRSTAATRVETARAAGGAAASR